MIKIVYNKIDNRDPISNVTLPDDEYFSYVSPFLHKMTDFGIAELSEVDTTSQTFLYELPWNSMLFLDKVYDSIDAKVIDGVKNHKGYLVINDSVDPTYRFNLENISNFLKDKGIPTRKLIYLSGCFDVDDADNYGLNLIACDWNETSTSKSAENFLNNEQFSMPKLKTFLSLNRTWHHHRLQFLYELYKNNLLNYFDISFLKHEMHTDRTFSFCLYEKSSGFYPDSELDNIQKLGQEIDNILPLKVDDIDALGGIHVSHSHIDMHSRYYFNVVTETTFYNFNQNNSGTHLSEKILKPILYKTPFILVGPPGGLRVLRKLGYKTFSDFIDESYDEITDPYKRMQAVIQLLKEISAISKGKLTEIDFAVRDICEHNFKHLVHRGETANNRLSRTIKKIVYSLC